MKPILLIVLLSSFNLTQACALNPIDQNPIKKSQSKTHTPLSKLSKSDSILIRFLKLYVKDTAVKKVLYIDGEQLKLNDSLIHFVKSNHWILILNSKTYNPYGIGNYSDSFVDQTLPCTELRYTENTYETSISFSHADINFEFAVFGFHGFLDLKTYVWNKTSKTFSIKE